MFAGLPGIGVGTLLYVLLAFWMPVHEFIRLCRGQSSLERWRVVGVQFSFAVGIVASVAVADRLLWILLGAASPGSVGVATLIRDGFAARAPGSVMASPVMASILLLVGLLAAVEVLRLVVTSGDDGPPEGEGSAHPPTFSEEPVN
jgi:hypothetical protein